MVPPLNGCGFGVCGGGLSALVIIEGLKRGNTQNLPMCQLCVQQAGTMTNGSGKRRRSSACLPSYQVSLRPELTASNCSLRYRRRRLLVSSFSMALWHMTCCLCCLILAAMPAAANANGRRPPHFHPAQRRAHSAVDIEPEYVPQRNPQQELSASATIDSSGNARVLNAAVTSGSTSSEPSAKLRADLLSGYDRGTFPWEEVWSTASSPTNRTGVPIEIGINFHRVHNVDVIEGTVDLIVWFRLRWNDPRLTWAPSDYGNLTSTWFWIGDGGGSAGETSEMWTPDLQLWNLDQGLEESLSDTYASVQNDGTVFWSRPGHLRPTCKFTGLDDFPFDTLGCQMEFGSWSYSGLYVRPIRMGLG